MENLTITDIKIPKPCSENWDRMTPTEKGAFCGKCQIEVVDFTNKSAEEIKSMLIQNRGEHLCVQMKKSQLFMLNHDFCEWENQSPPVFRSKFLLACVFVFGITLFTSCSDPEEESMDVGMVEYVETDTLASNNTESNKSVEELRIRTEVKRIRDNALDEGGFTLSKNVKGKLHYSSLGDYVVDLMTLDTDYTNAVDRDLKN